MALLAIAMPVSGAAGAVAQREPVTLSIVAVNPSAEKTQIAPVRIDLPQEVTLKDILDKGKLEVEYDDERALYYVHKDDVELAPKETKVFEVTVRDVWFIPEERLTSLKEYTGYVLDRLIDTEYYEAGQRLSQSIVERLDEIEAVQNDEALSRKSRIGAYRYHLQTIDAIQQDLARMEKLLAFAGGPPVPAMLEESPLKSDAPSTTTTWLVIFLIVVFIGLLGGQFFFTWHRRTQVTQDLDVMRQTAFRSTARSPGTVTSASAKPESGNGTPDDRQRPTPAGPRVEGSPRAS